MSRSSVKPTALAVGVMTAALAVASPALGYHIKGATYRGTHSQGGTVDFDVSRDGSRLTRFRATSIRGDNCTVESTEVTFPDGGGEIRSHVFGETGSGMGLSFIGEFHAKQRARGDFFYSTNPGPFDPGCLSPDITYTARTTASPAGSEECVQSKRYLRRQKKAVKRAKRAVRRARTAAAKRRAKRKLRTAKRRYRQARRDVRRDC